LGFEFLRFMVLRFFEIELFMVQGLGYLNVYSLKFYVFKVQGLLFKVLVFSV
jgi:hypothetical protein